MAADLAELGVTVGDFRAAYEAHFGETLNKVPDFVCVTKTGNPKQGARLVGECKADWESGMLEDYSKARIIDGSVQGATMLRRWLSKCLKCILFTVSSCSHLLGQVAAYLKHLHLRYGFITTYNHTIFVRYDSTDFNEDRTKFDTLHITKPIPWRQMYVPAQSGKDPVVSVRQAMWFLMLKASGGEDIWRMKDEKWDAGDRTGIRSGLRSRPQPAAKPEASTASLTARPPVPNREEGLEQRFSALPLGSQETSDPRRKRKEPEGREPESETKEEKKKNKKNKK